MLNSRTKLKFLSFEITVANLDSEKALNLDYRTKEVPLKIFAHT